jgi:hypothetical protein
MSSFLKFLYSIPTPFYIAAAAIMAPFFRWSASPTKQVEGAPKLSSEEQEARDKEDKEAFQKAIAEALNNEDFTKAVARHLAAELQPTLKEAFDPSALESKLLASNEHLSKGVTDSSTQNAAKLAELSTSLDTNNTTTAAKISALEAAVAEISTSVTELVNTVKAVQEQVASPDTSILTSHTASLDKISTNLQTLQEQGPAPIAAALGAHATKLDAVGADLTALKEKSDISESLKSLASDLAAVKTEIESGASANSTGFSGLKSQIEAAIAAIEAQNTTLADIKGADASKDILAATKASNDSHAAHSAAISEIKSIGKFSI